MKDFIEVALLPAIALGCVILGVRLLIEIAKCIKDRNNLGNIK